VTKLQAATDTIKEVVALYIALVLITAGLFSFIEGASLADSIYWAITTSTSTGYGDVLPKTLASKLVAGFLMITSIFVIAPMVVVRMIDKLNVNRDAFSHEEQVAMMAELTAIRVMLNNRLPSDGLFEIMPQLSSASPEPALRHMIYGYYRQHFTVEMAKVLTEEYIAALKVGQGA
jgi:voltage-gated potassium channel